jgi:hypothetical protein
MGLKLPSTNCFQSHFRFFIIACVVDMKVCVDHHRKWHAWQAEKKEIPVKKTKQRNYHK